MLSIIDQDTGKVELLPEWATVYDVLIGLKQLEANRARFRKENNPNRKSYYVPNGKPRGRPKKRPTPPASLDAPAPPADPHDS
jgi:hypothetical protein